MILEDDLPRADAIIDDVGADAPEIVDLAELVSLAIRIEPELLRKIRLQILPSVHAGTEADLWFSPLVESRSPGGFVLVPEVAQSLRTRLKAKPERLAAAHHLIESAHAKITPSLRLEEELTWLALAPMLEADRERAIEAGLRRALKTMVTESTREQDLARWALRAMPRLPASVRDSQAGWLLALSAGARLDGREVLAGDPPQGAVQEMRDLLPDNPATSVIGARLVKDGLELSHPPDPRAHTIEVPRTNPIVVSAGVGASGRRPQMSLRWDQVRVAPADPSQVQVETADGAVFALGAPTADLTVHLVQDSDKPGRLRMNMWAIDPDVVTEPGAILIQQDLRDFERIVEGLRSEEPPGRSVQGLGDLGYQISELLPSQFWDAFARLTKRMPERPPRVLIISDQPMIPWELAVVKQSGSRSSDRLPFLSLHAEVACWLAFPAPLPFALEVATIGVVAASSGPSITPLEHAEAEVDDLVSRRDATRIEPSLEQLEPWLTGRYRADVLHIAAHGDVERSGGQARIILADGAQLDGAVIESMARLAGSFVFVNTSFAAGGRGLVEALLAAGAAGVIAPMGQLDDQAAKEVAGDFYDRVFAGMPPAAALRDLRRKAIDRADGDATVLTYRYFGHPSTTLTHRPAAELWDVSTGTAIGSLIGHAAELLSVDYSRDGTLIATASEDRTVRIWRAATGRQLYVLAHAAAVQALTFSPDGSRLATASSDGRVMLWTGGTVDAVSSRVGSDPLVLAWSPTGERIGFISADGAVGLIDPRTGQIMSVQLLPTPATALAWGAAGSRLFAAYGDGVVVLDAPSGLYINPSGRAAENPLADPRGRQPNSEGSPVVEMAASPDGSTLVTAALDGSISLRDLSDESFIHVPSATNGRVLSLRFLGDSVVGITNQGWLKAWHAVTGSPIRDYPRIVPSEGAVLSPDGLRVVTFTRPSAEASPSGSIPAP